MAAMGVHAASMHCLERPSSGKVKLFSSWAERERFSGVK